MNKKRTPNSREISGVLGHLCQEVGTNARYISCCYPAGVLPDPLPSPWPDLRGAMQVTHVLGTEASFEETLHS